jgi:hypothetical protein
MFYAGASSTIIGNYLATYGRKPELDHQMVEDLGLSWKPYDGGGVTPHSDPTLSPIIHSGKYKIPILCEREVAATTEP